MTPPPPIELRGRTGQAVADASATAGHPTVSVVIATRDRPVLLRRALAAALAQDYAGTVECVIVFDQSDPEDLGVADTPGRQVRIVRNDRKPGLAGARNCGVAHATGELVAFCDDDDEWLPAKLGAQVQLMQRTGAPVVSCAITVRSEASSVVRRAPATPVGFADLLRDRVMALHPSTILADRSTLLGSIGLVDEDIPASYAEDYEWLLRAARQHPIPSVDRPLVDVHWHAQSFFTSRWESIVSALTYLLEKYPEIKGERVGYGRIAGQIAFACAASGHRGEARRWAGRALRRSPRELRGYLALAVASRAVSADTVMRQAQKRGRGI